MSESELRQAVVFAARFEFVTQRFLAPNQREALTLEQLSIDVEGPLPQGVVPVPNPARVREYWADVLPPGTPAHDYPPHWCGALCLFAIHRAELGLEVFWKGGFAARVLRQRAPRELPEPGDVAYFTKSQHHAIVERVNGQTFDSIDGNQQPGIRRRVGRKLEAAAAFYSLEPLLREKE
jgi:hypothetical protein